jgi:Ca-activated chloride channel family protein
MKRSDVEDRFQDLVDGALSDEETVTLIQEISSNEALRSSFESFKEIIRIESALSNETYELNENFVVKVMDALESQEQLPFTRRVIEMLTLNRRQVVGALTVCVVISFGVYIAEHAPLSELPPTQSSANVEVTTELSQITHSNDAQVSKSVGTALPQEPASLASSAKPALTLPPPPEKKGSSPAKVAQSGREPLANRSFETSAPADAEGDMVAGGSAPSVALGRKQEIVADESFGGSQPTARQSATRDEIAAERSLNLGESATFERRAPLTSAASAKEQKEKRFDIQDAAGSLTTSRELEKSASQSPLTNPLSTFSIDVDTGSYTNTRRALHEGHLPAPESVRVEEFLNYFDYNYPVQSSKPFALDYEIAPSPLVPEKYLLRLALAAKNTSRSDKPWNLVFLVDVSGSMAGSDRIDLLKRSLALLVAQMRPTDTVSIVTYAGSAGVLLDGGTGDAKARISSTIESLSTGGSTNGSGGITAAYQTAKKHLIPGSTNRVVLVTDGDFNVGTTSLDALKQLIAQQRDSGITLTTVGVGSGNFRDSTMEQLADVGNGNYFYLDSFTEARKIFETDLVGNMEVAAKDVKIQVEFNPQTVTQYRLIGYENRLLRREDFDNDRVDAGEIGAGHRVTALYELTLTTPPASPHNLRYRTPSSSIPSSRDISVETSNELAFLKVRFKAPLGDTSELLEFPLLLSQVKTTADEASVDFRFAAAVSYLGDLLRGNRNGANITFQQVATLAASNLGPDVNGYRREFVELVKNAGALNLNS